MQNRECHISSLQQLALCWSPTHRRERCNCSLPHCNCIVSTQGGSVVAVFVCCFVVLKQYDFRFPLMIGRYATRTPFPWLQPASSSDPCGKPSLLRNCMLCTFWVLSCNVRGTLFSFTVWLLHFGRSTASSLRSSSSRSSWATSSSSRGFQRFEGFSHSIVTC